MRKKLRINKRITSAKASKRNQKRQLSVVSLPRVNSSLSVFFFNFTTNKSQSSISTGARVISRKEIKQNIPMIDNRMSPTFSVFPYALLAL